MFEITPGEEVGDFDIKAKFLGVEMEKVQLHFQVSIDSVSLDCTLLLWWVRRQSWSLNIKWKTEGGGEILFFKKFHLKYLAAWKWLSLMLQCGIKISNKYSKTSLSPPTSQENACRFESVKIPC